MKLIFEWDKKEAMVNQQKHKISFEEAKTLFNDPLLLTFSDEYHSVNEERYISIGISAHGRILLIIHTEQKDSDDILIIRIISCRKATKFERQVYEEYNQ